MGSSMSKGGDTNPKELRLVEKNFKTFPKEVMKQKKLELLDLSKNNITELPWDLCNVSTLNYVLTVSQTAKASNTRYIRQWSVVTSRGPSGFIDQIHC